MSDVDNTAENTAGTVLNRRALLRAGGVMAGIAGIAGYAATQAPEAGALVAGPVVMGQGNNAGTSSTGLSTNAATPTLILTNSGRGAPLRLAEHTFSDWAMNSGDLINVGGELAFAHADSVVGSVYTSVSASQVVPVRPVRIVDTRIAAGRGNIVNRSGNLDSAGRLLGGHTIEIDLGSQVYLGTAVFANLTAVKAVHGGYLTLWPGGSRPHTSSLNYVTGQVIANFCVSGLNSDTVRLYAQGTTHVVLDVVAFAAGSIDDVRGAIQPFAAASALAAPTRKPPAWHPNQGRLIR